MHQAGEIVSRAQNAEDNSKGTQTTFETWVDSPSLASLMRWRQRSPGFDLEFWTFILDQSPIYGQAVS